ncbi:hypothetical protein PG996_014557 [Apiospora saccharicola]|uniref:Uncharacterized protein n=1 Tax=Apiospora saccharicola TaxID=335842 RepID=A0ABR1TIN3_9PEZI
MRRLLLCAPLAPSQFVASAIALPTTDTAAVFRLVQVRSWRLLPPHGWCHGNGLYRGLGNLADSFATDRPPSSTDLLFIYVDSFSFIMGSVILQYAFDPKNDSHCTDRSTNWKHIVRGCATPRLRSKFYIVNNFGAILIFGAFMAVFFVYRFSHVEDGACIIGIEQRALVIPVAFDVFVSIYLSVLFIIPLMKGTWNVEFELKGRTMSLGTQAMMAHPASARLRRLATKSLIGSCVTLTSSGSNLIALLVLDGEPAWLCLICCKTDILVNALVIFWITSTRDSSASARSLGTSTGPQCLTSRLITVPANQQEPDDPDVLPHPGHAWVPPPSNTVSVSRGARPTDLSIDDILYGMENTDDFVRRNDKSPRGKHPNVVYTEGSGDLREEAEEEEEEQEQEE